MEFEQDKNDEMVTIYENLNPGIKKSGGIQTAIKGYQRLFKMFYNRVESSRRTEGSGDEHPLYKVILFITV